jgi:hypothetical protein
MYMWPTEPNLVVSQCDKMNSLKKMMIKYEKKTIKITHTLL